MKPKIPRHNVARIHKTVMEMYVYHLNKMDGVRGENNYDPVLTANDFLKHAYAPSRVIFFNSKGPEHAIFSCTANWDEGGDAQITAFIDTYVDFGDDGKPTFEGTVQHILVGFDGGIYTVYQWSNDPREPRGYLIDGKWYNDSDDPDAPEPYIPRR